MTESILHNSASEEEGVRTAQPIHIYRRIQEIHEEAGLELVTILLDWEKAFDKIQQGKLLSALRRIGIPDKVVRVIDAICRSQHARLTVARKDIDSQLTREERHTLSNERPIGMDVRDGLLYADDTLTLASSRQAAEIMLHKIQEESNKYNMYEIKPKEMYIVGDELPGECSISRRRNHACRR